MANEVGTGYTTNKNGVVVAGYTQGNNTGTVAKGSIYDPMSSNYNAAVANNSNLTVGGLTQAQVAANTANAQAAQGVTTPVAQHAVNSGSSALQSTVQPTMQAAVMPSTTMDPNNYNGSGYTSAQLFAAIAAANGGTASTTPTTTNATGVTDNSSKISDQYAASLSAAQDALKQSIAESEVPYQSTITNAPAAYQPLRDQASYAGATNLQNDNEMLANNGQQGGVNRTDNTQINSATENNINSLNQQQQKVIDDANASIAQLQASGDTQSAQLVAQNASDKITALINESNRVSAANTAAAQQTFDNGVTTAGLTGTYNGTSTIVGKSLSDTEAQQVVDNANTAAGLTGTMADGTTTLAGKTLQNTVSNDAIANNIAEGNLANSTATTNANIAQQTVDNTGYTSDGKLTVAGQTAAANIASSTADTALKSAQLKEITDPNSTTNQLAKLGLQTAQLNYAALPAQLQAQADTTAQNLAAGKISIATAQTQLNALPAQLAASLANTQANTSATLSNAAATALNAATNASQAAKSGSSGGSGGSTSSGTSSTATTKTQDSNYQSAIASATTAASNGTLGAWVQANMGAMTDNLSAVQKASLMEGGSTYEHLLKGV